MIRTLFYSKISACYRSQKIHAISTTFSWNIAMTTRLTDFPKIFDDAASRMLNFREKNPYSLISLAFLVLVTNIRLNIKKSVCQSHLLSCRQCSKSGRSVIDHRLNGSVLMFSVNLIQTSRWAWKSWIFDGICQSLHLLINYKKEMMTSFSTVNGKNVFSLKWCTKNVWWLQLSSSYDSCVQTTVGEYTVAEQEKWGFYLNKATHKIEEKSACLTGHIRCLNNFNQIQAWLPNSMNFHEIAMIQFLFSAPFSFQSIFDAFWLN